MTYHPASSTVGLWLISKLRRHQINSGTFHAAKLARKQGMPLELARAVLASRGPRPGAFQ